MEEIRNSSNKILLFNAAKNGDVRCIATVLNRMDEAAVKNCLNYSVEGTTPLIVAARHGQDKVVEYLLSKGADPCQRGAVSFDNEIITEVPPLWAAAAAGYLRTCEVLVQHKVDVNQTTITNSTPLRGACYDGHLEIVKFLVANGADIEIANRHGHTALMISCFRGKEDLVDYLLSIGASVNRRSVKGSTALHDAADNGSLSIVKKLIDAGAIMQKDSYGVTPLLTSVMMGHSQLMSFLFTFATPAEQQDSLKLLGASMIDRRMDFGSAIVCWKEAFTICKKSSVEKEVKHPEMDEIRRRIYCGYQEIQCLDDVENLIGDPEAVKMQALIIRERILGESHPEVHYFLRFRGFIYADMGKLDRAFDLWFYILQLEQHYFLPLNMNTTSLFVAFLDAFTASVDALILYPERQWGMNQSVISVEHIIVVVERAIYEAERYLRYNGDDIDDGFEDRDFQLELENLLCVIFQLLSLANRLYIFYSQDARSNTMEFNIINHDLIGTAETACESPNGSPSSSVTSYSGNSLSEKQPSTIPESCLFANSREDAPALSNRYTIGPTTKDAAKRYSLRSSLSSECFCANAYLAPLTDDSRLFERRPKLAFPMRPRCPHLKCLVKRMITIFCMLKIKPLHVACDETRTDDQELKRTPRQFVVKKLLEAGVDVRSVDEWNNTALHVILANANPHPQIVRLLLDTGVPLLARNFLDHTCLYMINKSHTYLIKCLRIGRYLSLKQICANVVMRNLSGKQTFKDVLPRELEEFIRVF